MTQAQMTQATMDAPQIIDRDSATRFTEQLHGLMVSLTQHLQRETDELKSGTYTHAALDHETKSDLVHAYRTALGQLQTHKKVLVRFVPVKLDELRQLNEAFQSELQKNLATVSTAKAVSEHLLTQLAEQVSTDRQPKTYGASGTMNRRAKAAAISVDRAL